MRALIVSVVPSKGQTHAQVATRFNFSRQNNIGEDRLWTINKSRLVYQRGGKRFGDICDHSRSMMQ